MRCHLISLATRIKHIYWNFRCILTDKEILPRLSELTYLYSQKSTDNSFAGESESLKFVTGSINNINQYHPLHYQEKSWITDELIGEYKDELGRRI